jgi:GTPase SAR1 family protein
MFNWLFGNSKTNAIYKSHVAYSRSSLNAFLKNRICNENYIVIMYFEDSVKQLKSLLPEEKKQHVFLAEKIISGFGISPFETLFISQKNRIVCGERYPLAAKENELTIRLRNERIDNEPEFYAALDDVFFMAFGGDGIAQMMKRMGLQETEMIESTMVDKSIRKAQEKLAKKVSIESQAHSAKEWFTRNVPQA